MASFCLLSALFRHTRSFAFRRKETVKISVFIHFSNVKRKVFYLIIFIVVSELYKNGNDQTRRRFRGFVMQTEGFSAYKYWRG